MADSIIEMTAAETARKVNARERSAREIVDGTFEYVRRTDGEVGAFLSLTEELARAQADRVDARIAAGERLPLAGVALAVKDNMCLRGTQTTAGSKILEGWNAPYTATAVQRIIDAGAISIGKTNLDEFAMGSSCENSALGVTRNPYDPGVPGEARAAAPQPWRATRAQSVSAATPAARYASPRHFAISSDSNRRTDAFRVMA